MNKGDAKTDNEKLFEFMEKIYKELQATKSERIVRNGKSFLHFTLKYGTLDEESTKKLERETEKANKAGIKKGKSLGSF